MEFDWDDDKRARTLREHGVDLIRAARVFRDPNRLDWLDERRNYGEERRVTMGRIGDDERLVVVYTRRGDVVRLITAWKASRRDERRYSQRAAPSKGDA